MGGMRDPDEREGSLERADQDWKPGLAGPSLSWMNSLRLRVTMVHLFSSVFGFAR